MYTAAVETQQAPDRLSFTTAVQLITEALPDFQLLAPSHWAARWALLMRDIAQARLPQRRLRTQPRVVKRRVSKFPQKKPEKPGLRGTPRQAGTYAEWLVILPVDALI